MSFPALHLITIFDYIKIYDTYWTQHGTVFPLQAHLQILIRNLRLLLVIENAHTQAIIYNFLRFWYINLEAVKNVTNTFYFYQFFTLH